MFKRGSSRPQRPKLPPSYGGYESSWGGSDYFDWGSPSPAERRRKQEQERKKKRRRIMLGLATVLGIAGFGVVAAGLLGGEHNDARAEELKALVSPTTTLVSPEVGSAYVATAEEEDDDLIDSEVEVSSTPLATVRAAFEGSPTPEPSQQPTQTATELVPKPTEVVPTAVPTEESSEVWTPNGTIQLDADGIPTSYTRTDGTLMVFTPEQQTAFRQAHTTALASGEPEVITDIILSDGDTAERNYTGSPDRPRVTELPADVMTETDLRANGVITIIQAPNTQFYMRPSAFKPGGILEDLPAAQSLEHPIQLQIVFVDGPLISQNYMTDSRYDGVRDLVPFISSTDVEAYRNEWIQRFEDDLNNIRASTPDDDQLLLLLKQQIYRYQSMSDEEIMSEIIGGDEKAAGLFVTNSLPNAEGVIVGTVFVATGRSARQEGTTLHLYFDEHGEVHTQTGLDITTSADFRPSASAAFPRREDFRRNPNAQRETNDYPYGAQNGPGQILDHELKHFKLILLDPALRGTTRNSNEYDTDEAAMAEIDEQYATWEASGYQDDSAYPWVFTIPTELGGGYMLTEYQPPTNQEPKVVNI